MRYAPRASGRIPSTSPPAMTKPWVAKRWGCWSRNDSTWRNRARSFSFWSPRAGFSVFGEAWRGGESGFWSPGSRLSVLGSPASGLAGGGPWSAVRKAGLGGASGPGSDGAVGGWFLERRRRRRLRVVGSGSSADCRLLGMGRFGSRGTYTEINPTGRVGSSSSPRVGRPTDGGGVGWRVRGSGSRRGHPPADSRGRRNLGPDTIFAAKRP